MQYKGSCHCGRIAFQVERTLTGGFNKHTIKHRFCPKCGMHPYGEGSDPKGNRMAAINIRCLEGIELETIPVTHFDGRAL